MKSYFWTKKQIVPMKKILTTTSLIMFFGFVFPVCSLTELLFTKDAQANDLQQNPTTERGGLVQSNALALTNPNPNIEQKVLDILKAMSDRLSGDQTMTFTAVTTYESPSRLGPALAYNTVSNVTLQRPNKLQIIVPGDGPASEFYYNGKTMIAYAPEENLVAVADAPPTIDALLKFAYDNAAIYFPFSDVIVADPYKDIVDKLEIAFYIGQSKVIDGTKTDMFVIATNKVFAQVWIGSEDKLPRMIRAVYSDDPLKLRHQVTFSNWQLDVPIPAGTFASSRANDAKRIKFKHPNP